MKELAIDNLRRMFINPVPASPLLERCTGELRILPGDVHVWTESLGQLEAHVSRMAPLLGEDERLRADRFHFKQHRDGFITGRGLLRVILANYLGCNPSEVKFEYGEAGKPAVAGDQKSGLHFNLAHSGDLVVYALNLDRRIGVDIELVRPMPDAEQIAANYFSPDEIRDLKWLPAQQMLAGFFACWTRKEAYVKAIGTGLGHRLSDFSVNARPDERARLISIQGDTQLARRWSYADICLGPAYCGAIAVEGRINNLVYLRAKQVLDSGAWS